MVFSASSLLCPFSCRVACETADSEETGRMGGGGAYKRWIEKEHDRTDGSNKEEGEEEKENKDGLIMEGNYHHRFMWIIHPIKKCVHVTHWFRNPPGIHNSVYLKFRSILRRINRHHHHHHH